MRHHRQRIRTKKNQMTKITTLQSNLQMKQKIKILGKTTKKMVLNQTNMEDVCLVVLNYLPILLLSFAIVETLLFSNFFVLPLFLNFIIFIFKNSAKETKS